MVNGGNTMNLQQPYSGEAFQLQTKILTEDNPHDLERIVNDYLEILAYKKTCRVVDITYQMRKTHLLSSLCGLFGSQQVDEYSAMIIYQEPARFESRIFETEEAPEEEN